MTSDVPTGHHKPNWLWCERCQAWIETQHLCGARYIDKGDHYEPVCPAVSSDVLNGSLSSDSATLRAENAALKAALIDCALPYEALLADWGSRRWIADRIWADIERAVAASRAALLERRNKSSRADTSQTNP
jgi:hypothetical protein